MIEVYLEDTYTPKFLMVQSDFAPERRIMKLPLARSPSPTIGCTPFMVL